jgi:hypothetical protein
VAEIQNQIQGGGAPIPIWWSFFIGPLAWAGDLGFSYVLAQHACSTGHHYVLHVVSIVFFLIALSGVFVGITELQKFPSQATEKGGRPLDRAYFQAIFGIAFSLSFAIVIVAESLPPWILGPCL